MQPVLGYRSKSAAIRAMKAEGLSSAEIGQRIGMSGSAVSQLAYCVRKRADSPQSDEKRQRVYMAPYMIAALKPHADKRGIAATTLVQRIVIALLEDNLIDAVLDDQEPVA
jgi:predicted transcriptional regulator